jgi:TonB family protein
LPPFRPEPDPVVAHLVPYPPIALGHLEEGTVTLDLTVASDGSVEDAQILKSSGSAQLDAAALTGVGNWRYKPVYRNGAPVSYHWEVAVQFHLRA